MTLRCSLSEGTRMPYQILVAFHLLGSAIWIGGHVVLVAVILPAAIRERAVAPVVEFERSFGKLGLAALVVQTATGLWLTTRWVGDWRTIFSSPSPAAHFVLAKLVLLVVTIALAGHATHRLLPRLSPERIGVFAVHAWIVTVIAALMLVVGVLIRTGG